MMRILSVAGKGKAFFAVTFSHNLMLNVALRMGTYGDLRKMRNPLGEAMQDSRAFMVHQIRARFPKDSVITDVNEMPGPEPGHVWAVRPLDFIEEHGTRHIGISLGLVLDGTPAAGALFYPAQKLMFLGVNGLGSSVSHGLEETAKFQLKTGEVHEPNSLWNTMAVNPPVTEALSGAFGRAYRYFGFVRAMQSSLFGVRDIFLGSADHHVHFNPTISDVAGIIPIMLGAGGHVYAKGYGESGSIVFDLKRLRENNWIVPGFIASRTYGPQVEDLKQLL